MTANVLRRLTLTDFRSYAGAELALDGRPVFLVGPNGAGKTNLLEAVSLFTPGRGLRGAAIAELGRRRPGEPAGRAWAVSAVRPVRARFSATRFSRAGARSSAVTWAPAAASCVGRLTHHQVGGGAGGWWVR